MCAQASSFTLCLVFGESLLPCLRVHHLLAISIISLLNKQYYRGAWYLILLLPMLSVMLINLAGMIRCRKRLSHKAFLSFLFAFLPIIGITFVQRFIEIYPLFDICVVLSAISMYGLILSDQIEQDLLRQREIVRQEQEIAHQRANIMVLQMHPHFIYNTTTRLYLQYNDEHLLSM